MSLGSGTHLWNHHVFSWLQELKAKGVVQTNLCKHLFSFSLLILNCLHHQWSLSWFPFNFVCIGFHGLPTYLLKGGGVVSFSWICDYISFKRAQTSNAIANNLSSLHIYDAYLSQIYIRMYLHGISKMQVWWSLHYGNIFKKCASSNMCVNEKKGYSK